MTLTDKLNVKRCRRTWNETKSEQKHHPKFVKTFPFPPAHAQHQVQNYIPILSLKTTTNVLDACG